MYKRFKQYGVGATLAAGSMMAMAAVPTAVTDAIEEAATDVGVIGAAVFLVIVAAAVFKWIRRAL